MKVLWLISVTLPQVGQALGLAGQHGGGWILGQLNELRTQAELTVCTVNSKVSEPTALRLAAQGHRRGIRPAAGRGKAGSCPYLGQRIPAGSCAFQSV